MNDSLVAQESEVVDLETLKSRCLGNLALVERVLATFRNQLDADLEALEQALRSGDLDTFALVAHRVKGMAANVEARGLSACAAAAEQQARDRVAADLSAQLDEMQQERGRLALSFAGKANVPKDKPI